MSKLSERLRSAVYEIDREDLAAWADEAAALEAEIEEYKIERVAWSKDYSKLIHEYNQLEAEIERLRASTEAPPATTARPAPKRPPMSRWTHAICDACWTRKNPDRRPTRLLGIREACCYCGAKADGIYTRDDPSQTPCGGAGGSHESA